MRRLLARDVAEDCRLSKIPNIVADSVRAEGGRQPMCPRASHQLARSVVAPSPRTCKSSVGISVAWSVGMPTVLPIRPVANFRTSYMIQVGIFGPPGSNTQGHPIDVYLAPDMNP